MSSIRTASEVYKLLEDEISKSLFENMLYYNVTENEHPFLVYRTKVLFSEYGVHLDEFLGADGEKIIFGAGFWGKWLSSACSDVNWKCFADNFPQKDSKIHLPIIHTNELKKFPNAKIVISVSGHTREILEQLLGLGFTRENIFSIGDELKQIADDLLKRQYFDLPYLTYGNNEVFVDVGCFDGLTSRNFAEKVKDNYRHIYAFEANPKLYTMCADNMKDLKNHTLYNNGAWDKKDTIDFYESPNDAEFYATIAEHSGYQAYNRGEQWNKRKVAALPLDDVLSNEKVTFIKMDIEGAEKHAILGAKNIIQNCKPKLAISLYHRKDDIVELPALISDIRPDYKLYIRNYTFSWPETVLYAV